VKEPPTLLADVPASDPMCEDACNVQVPLRAKTVDSRRTNAQGPHMFGARFGVQTVSVLEMNTYSLLAPPTLTPRRSRTRPYASRKYWPSSRMVPPIDASDKSCATISVGRRRRHYDC